MRYRKLGRTGLKVSEMALGCASFGGPADEKASIEILDRALGGGITLFDTSNIYQGGRSEEILGKAMKGWQRDKVVIATKVGGKTGEGCYDAGLSRKHIMTSIEESLRRLQTDYIDIYQAHWPDQSTPIDETLYTFDSLVRAGKVRYVGCSNYTAWELCKALWTSSENKLTRFDCVQPRYNLITRWIEYDLIPLCVNEGIGLITYNPLAGGFLTGKYHREGPPLEESRFGGELGGIYRRRYWYERNFEAVEKLSSIVRDFGHTLPQVALAWVLHNQAISSVIIGVNSIDQLMANLSCLDITMPQEELDALEQVWEDMLPAGWFFQMGHEEYKG